jgi:hypothetical protein
MRTLITGGFAAAGLLAFAATAAAQGDNPDNGGTKLVASLTGAGEAAVEGDEDGAGLFEALVNPETERICYAITAGAIDKATVAQIHAGAAGETGDPVLTLDTPDGDDDDSEDCQDIDAGLAQALIANPQNYYVNVRTGAYPSGAIRGQLGGTQFGG